MLLYEYVMYVLHRIRRQITNKRSCVFPPTYGTY